MTALQADSLLILLQRLDRPGYRDRVDLENGASYQWVSSSVSVQSLTTKARQLASAQEDTQLCHFQICALDAGTLESISVEALSVEPERTKECRICFRHLPERYYDSVLRTGKPYGICMRCRDASNSKIPEGHLPNYRLTRGGDL